MATAKERAQRVVDSVFAHDGVDGFYTAPTGGAAKPCRVLRNGQDRVLASSFGRPIAEGNTIEVRRSEIETVARGGVFDVDGTKYRVSGDPQIDDADRLVWSCTVA